MSCGNKPPLSSPESLQPRREVQRASLQAEDWQFVVCGNDPLLTAHLDSLAATRPFGKRVQVVDCDGLIPGIPSIVFGDRLPAELAGLGQVLTRPPISMGSGDLVILNNYLRSAGQGVTISSTVSAYIAETTTDLLAYLQEAEYSDWGGIFRGRWAYEVYGGNGAVRYGSYRGDGWQFDGSAEIVLPPPGPAVLVRDGVYYYSVDEAVTYNELRSLLDSLAERPTDSLIRAVYVYPDVARLGLRRGNMEARQLEGTTLHLLRSEFEVLKEAPRATDAVFLCGMTFAHEGYRVYNGYGGTTVAPALDSLLKLEVNAVAIVPYTFMRDASTVGDLPVPTNAGSENDGAVIYSVQQAHARGLTVLLKPQIWVGGGWPGEVSFATEAEWEQFFTAYQRWILHYARMAERQNIAALCIGTELVQTTLQHPERWRDVIAAVRKEYRGKLTYAANWGVEFEQLTFWEDLDIIGLNSYYPLSDEPLATDEELLQGATAWMLLADSIAARHIRPLWLTEVGYRSVVGAWINPHAEAGDRAQDPDAQARSYRALTTAATKSAQLRGMFVWKWPSYLGRGEGGERDTGFTPGGKPAAGVLTDFYRQVSKP